MYIATRCSWRERFYVIKPSRGRKDLIPSVSLANSYIRILLIPILKLQKAPLHLMLFEAYLRTYLRTLKLEPKFDPKFDPKFEFKFESNIETFEFLKASEGFEALKETSRPKISQIITLQYKH